MRLVDADALDMSLGSSDRDIYVKETLDEAPTIEPADILAGMWVPVTERLPEEKISRMTSTFTFYPCVYRSKVNGVCEVRYYQFGNGHFWHGPEVMDGNIVAWADPMPLPILPVDKKN